MENQTAIPELTEGFKDPTTLTDWTRRILFAYLAATPVWFWIAIRSLRGDELGSGMGWARIVFLLIWLTSVALVLIWMYRAHCNIRALGATGLTFSPGWAVGWFFVPIAFFWMPHQAMQELWRASASPEEWQRQPGSVLLSWWWALWLLDLVIMLDIVLLPFPAHALAEGLVHIPLNLIFIALIGRVSRMQMVHYRGQVAGGS